MSTDSRHRYTPKNLSPIVTHMFNSFDKSSKGVKKIRRISFKRSTLRPSFDRTPIPMNLHTQTQKKKKSPVKVENPDWAFSYLDQCAFKGAMQFNYKKNPGIFTYAQLKECLVAPRQADAISKLTKTIKKLKQELFLSSVPMYQKSLFCTCSHLFDTRIVTLEILKNIHNREHIFKKMFDLTEAQAGLLKDFYTKYILLSSKIESMIDSWKDLNIPFDQFIYSDENYLDKIQKDTKLLKSRFGLFLSE